MKDVFAQCPITPTTEIEGVEVESEGRCLLTYRWSSTNFQSIANFLRPGTNDNKYGTIAMEAYVRRTTGHTTFYMLQVQKLNRFNMFVSISVKCHN